MATGQRSMVASAPLARPYTLMVSSLLQTNRRSCRPAGVWGGEGRGRQVGVRRRWVGGVVGGVGRGRVNGKVARRGGQGRRAGAGGIGHLLGRVSRDVQRIVDRPAAVALHGLRNRGGGVSGDREQTQGGLVGRYWRDGSSRLGLVQAGRCSRVGGAGPGRPARVQGSGRQPAPPHLVHNLAARQLPHVQLAVLAACRHVAVAHRHAGGLQPARGHVEAVRNEGRQGGG